MYALRTVFRGAVAMKLQFSSLYLVVHQAVGKFDK